MDVSTYYQISQCLIGILRENKETETAEKLDEILRNEDEDSPRTWIPKFHSKLKEFYEKKIGLSYSNELLQVLVAGESSKKHW